MPIPVNWNPYQVPKPKESQPAQPVSWLGGPSGIGGVSTQPAAAAPAPQVAWDGGGLFPNFGPSPAVVTTLPDTQAGQAARVQQRSDRMKDPYWNWQADIRFMSMGGMGYGSPSYGLRGVKRAVSQNGGSNSGNQRYYGGGGGGGGGSGGYPQYPRWWAAMTTWRFGGE